MDILAIWLGKLTLLGLRAAGRRGTALPGLVVEKLFPRFLPRRLARLANGVVVVSGTNGKTTTTKMVATVLAQRMPVLTNDTGGNFVRGCITAVLQQSSWLGRSTAEVAVFELDEAHAVRFCQVYQPQRLLLLNVLRDQLDRFGEIDTTARAARQGCRPDHRPGGAEPGRPAAGRAGRRPGRRGELLRGRCPVAVALPDRRGALRRPDRAVAVAGHRRASLGGTRSEHRADPADRRGGRAARRCGPRARTMPRTRRQRRRWRSLWGCRPALSRPVCARSSRPSAGASPSWWTAGGWCCSW